MIEMQTKHNNGASQQAQYDFSAFHEHLQALSDWFVRLLGNKYAIPLDKIRERDDSLTVATHCIYFTHNEKHEDQNPSAWIKVFKPKGQLVSGCSKCGRAQVVSHNGEMQPAPTLLTLSRRDERLLKTLLDLDCKEFPLTEEEAKVLEVELPEKEKRNRRPRVGFPVTYDDGSQGFHFRVALEGKEKWRHMLGRKAGEAVFGLHNETVKQKIQSQGFVIITESPLDAATLIAADFPAISCCGKKNAKAFGCDQHRETLLSLLGDAGTIYVWVEPDAAEFPQEVANALQRTVKVITPPVPEEDPKALKDAFRIWLACGKDWERFKAEIDRLIENATEVVTPQPEPVQATEPQTNSRKVEIPETIFKRLGDIKVQEVGWLVDEYIPIGAVTLLAGEGGAGKSSLLCDITAAILKGDKWLIKFPVSQGGVILILTEGETEIKNRLVEGYGVEEYDDPVLIVDLTDWENYTPLKAAQALPEILEMAKESLRAKFGNIPIRLVGLDCLRGFGFDEAKASRQKGDRLPTVREIYKPLAEFAEKEGSAVIVTHHFRKLQPDERRRLYPKWKKGKEVAPDIDINLLRSLIAGTADIVNSARHALVVVSDLEAGLGIIVPVKSNRSDLLGAPIRYDWKTETPKFIKFMEEEETALEAAIAFLRRVLSKGEIPSNELLALAKKEGISETTYWRARSRLGVKARRVCVNGEKLFIAYLPNPQENETDQQGSPTKETNPPDRPAGDGSLPTNPADNTNFDQIDKVASKPKQNLAFPTSSSETGYDKVGKVGNEPACKGDRQLCQLCQTQNDWQSSLTKLESPINTRVSGLLCQLCQTSGNVETRPEGDPQEALPEPVGSPTEPERPEGNPTDQPANETQAAQPEPAGNPPAMPASEPEGDPLWVENEELWCWFTPERLKPSARPNQPKPDRQASPPEPTEPERPDEGSPAGDLQPDRKPKAKDLLVSYTAEVITEAKCPVCETELEPERNGKAACLGCGRLYFVVAPPQTSVNSQPAREHEGSPPASEPANEPEVSPPDQSGLSACVEARSETPTVIKQVEGGCVFVATADWVEDEGIVVVTSDDSPPESPTLTGDSPQEALPAGNPPEPNLQANEPDQPVAILTEPICPFCGEILEPDHNGLATCAGCGRRFEVETPPDDDDNPPESPDGSPPEAPQGNLIYSNKFNPPAQSTRMTERLPDGSVKLAWKDKAETVAPTDLTGWQHIEQSQTTDSLDIESVEIPPVVVLDLETTNLDPAKGRILAAGLALYVESEAKEMTIIYNNEVSDDGEANLLLQVFDWLRETYDKIGEFILTGYNMFDFDLRYLIERSRRLGLKRDCPFDYEKDKEGKIKYRSIPDTQGKYTYISIVSKLPIKLIDTQHLVIRWDEFEKALFDYRLKTAVKQFGVNIPDRPELTPEEIVHAFYNDRAKFNAYLLADLRETYALFDILIEPYLGIAAITGFDLEDLARLHGRGWVWEQHYRRHYPKIPEADKIHDYKGGLVVSRKGLWFNCAKFDIASLYPTIVLAYRIHSRKDPEQVGLQYLKTYWKYRMLLKQKAKETGDRSAQILQSGLKVLNNSYYGYFGSTYSFNDIKAAERVTEIGRKVLTCMIAAVEDLGLFVVEADTDGLIVCCQDKDPQEVWKAISDAIPPVFKVELEWQGMTVFVSEDKHYIVYDRNGDLVLVKGSKWRGRDKPAYQREAIPTFLQKWLKQGKEAALEYARQVLEEIRSGNGWDWVVCTRRVSVNGKSLQAAGFKAGERVTYAYKNYKRKEISQSPAEGYDCKYYAGEFSDLVKEVIEAIDPAQIKAWERMVG
jgi:hypothetical protein